MMILDDDDVREMLRTPEGRAEVEAAVARACGWELQAYEHWSSWRRGDELDGYAWHPGAEPPPYLSGNWRLIGEMLEALLAFDPDVVLDTRDREEWAISHGNRDYLAADTLPEALALAMGEAGLLR